MSQYEVGSAEWLQALDYPEHERPEIQRNRAMAVREGIVKKTIDVYYQLNFDHALMNPVMRIIKEEKIKILSQDLGLACVLKIAIRKRDVQEIMNRFDRLYKVNTKKII